MTTVLAYRNKEEYGMVADTQVTSNWSIRGAIRKDKVWTFYTKDGKPIYVGLAWDYDAITFVLYSMQKKSQQWLNLNNEYDIAKNLYDVIYESINEEYMEKWDEKMKNATNFCLLVAAPHDTFSMDYDSWRLESEVSCIGSGNDAANSILHFMDTTNGLTEEQVVSVLEKVSKVDLFTSGPFTKYKSKIL